MKKISRMISFCLLMIFATESFAKSVDPIRHAAGSAEGRLALEAFQERIIGKLAAAPVARQKSILFGLYKLGVKSQNKVQSMDIVKLTSKLNSKIRKQSAADDQPLTGDEVAASDFIADSTAGAKGPAFDLSVSHVERVIAASSEALTSVVTPVDANGKFQALKKSAFFESVQNLTGDGDYSGLAEAFKAFIFAVLAIFVIGAIVIVGLAVAAFGLPGALVSVAVIGLVVIIVLNN